MCASAEGKGWYTKTEVLSKAMSGSARVSFSASVGSSLGPLPTVEIVIDDFTNKRLITLGEK